MRARALDIAMGGCALIVSGLMPLLAPPANGAEVPLASTLVSLGFVSALLGLVAFALWQSSKRRPD